jgi:uncharacterized protein YybS (DUF2232 family)
MENRDYKTKSMVEAALISALIVVLMLLNAYVPLFSAIGTFLMPIPVTVLFIRYNYKITLGAIAVSTILIGVLYNPILAITAAVTYTLTGMTLGYCIKKDKNVSTTLLYMTIASIISIIFSTTIMLLFIQKTTIYNLLKLTLDTFKEQMKFSSNLSEKIGGNKEQIDATMKMFQSITPETLMTMIPAALIMGGFTSAFINYVAIKSILKKLKYNIKELTPFEKVYLDNRIGALIIIFVCLGIILNAKNFEIGKYILMSASSLLQYAFLIAGMAVAVFYMKNRFNLNKTARVLIIIFALVSQMVMVFVYIGIADMIFDFRKLDKNRIFRKKTN